MFSCSVNVGIAFYCSFIYNLIVSKVKQNMHMKAVNMQTNETFQY